MKTTIRLAALLLICSAGFGQTIRPVLIGIDVAKPLLSLVTPNRPAFRRSAFRLAEATVKLPVSRERYLSLAVGYGQLRTDFVYRNVLMNLRGVYVKAGTEKFQRGGLLVGWHGLAAISHESASYSFQGPTFGDYTATAFDHRRVAVGVEGILGYQRTVSNRLLMRVAGRATLAGLLGPRPENIAVVFVPGVGLAAGDPAVYSLGLGVFLFYRTNPRPVAGSPE